MVNDFSAGEFMETHYHSQYDNENFYQEPVYRFHHEMYAGLVLAFDRTAAVPMNLQDCLREQRPVLTAASAAGREPTCRGCVWFWTRESKQEKPSMKK